MTTMDIKEILSNHPFLEGMEAHFIDLVSGCAQNAVFHEGQYIFKEGEDAEKFYLLRTGRAALEFRAAEKGNIRIQTISAGEVLGWSWLISPHYWHFDAIAVEDTRALVIDGLCLRNKCDADREFGYEMYKRFSAVLEQRLKSTRLQLLDFYADLKGAGL